MMIIKENGLVSIQVYYMVTIINYMIKMKSWKE